jgi:hypothetical protein
MTTDDRDDPDEVTQELQIDGTTYRLLAHRTLGGFHAIWDCGERGQAAYCGLRNPSSEAIEAAKMAALAQHSSRRRIRT